MIWILLILTAIVAALVLFTPLLSDKTSGKNRPVWAGLAALSIAAIIGIYAINGRPDLTGDTPIAQSTPSHPTIPEAGSAPELVARLKQRLISTNSQDIAGWTLLARSQMQVGQYDDALQSYQILLQIDPSNAAAQSEYEQAESYVQRQQMMAQAQTMSPQDQQAMISGMVEGLAARVYKNGGTPEEWARLLRARKVLGQHELLAKDIALMKKQFEDQPDMIPQILDAAE